MKCIVYPPGKRIYGLRVFPRATVRRRRRTVASHTCTVILCTLEDASNREVVARVPGVRQGIAILVDEPGLLFREALLIAHKPEAVTAVVDVVKPRFIVTPRSSRCRRHALSRSPPLAV